MTCLSTLSLLRTFQSGQLICGMQGRKKRWLKSRRSMVAWDSQIKTYVLNIHNMPKIFWGAWPLTTLERPKCSKVWVPLSKLSVSKNVWFTNAILGPLDFIHSEMLKRGMGGVRPVWKTASGDYYFRGWTPPVSIQRVSNWWLRNHQLVKFLGYQSSFRRRVSESCSCSCSWR